MKLNIDKLEEERKQNVGLEDFIRRMLDPKKEKIASEMDKIRTECPNPFSFDYDPESFMIKLMRINQTMDQKRQLEITMLEHGYGILNLIR